MNSVFVRQEGGFTTPAAAVALLVVCGLLFVTMRGFIIGTRAGEIQYVADAGALAADNAVAEFVTAGQVVDAALLSFSLVGITVYAASAVASFIPGGAAAAAELASAGSKVLQLRDKFAETAVKGLNAAQEALPVICAVRSAQVITANADASGVDYVGIALASPLHADPVELPDNTEVNEAARDIESRETKIQEKSEQQKRAQEQQDAAKQRAFEADCGSSTCLRERASHLAGLPDAQNPSYSSIKTWTFAAPLARAKAYYALRLQNEPGSTAAGTPERVAESVARKQFYEYAQKEVSGGSIERTERGVELPNLKPLARNTEQIRSTYLYTQRIYPVSQNGDKRVLHAYAGCPAYQSGTPSGTASVQEIDGGSVQRCETCRFSAVTLGRVPAASTSIDNGFEYYYKAVVDASQEYRAAALESEQIRRELEEEAEGIRGDLKKAEDAIDHQLKDFDAKAAEEKTERIKALYFERDFPAWVPLQTLWNPRWLNKTYQLEDIAAELTERKQKIDSDMQMLSTVPEFGNLAAECYKDTLDPAKAIELARGILEKQKKAAEKEQQLQPLEKEPPKMEEAAETSREWVSFRCLMSESEAKSLNTFFRMNHIRFEAIDE